MNHTDYSFSYAEDFERILKKLRRKDSVLLERIKKKIISIVKSPLSGKPLKNALKNYRRVHVGSFVLLYEIKEKEVRFLNFDHHDKVYQKT